MAHPWRPLRCIASWLRTLRDVTWTLRARRVLRVWPWPWGVAGLHGSLHRGLPSSLLRWNVLLAWGEVHLGLLRVEQGSGSGTVLLLRWRGSHELLLLLLLLVGVLRGCHLIGLLV